MTITETRPHDKQTANMDNVGGITAAQARQDRGTDQFEEALALWLHRRQAINSLPLNSSKDQEGSHYDLLQAAEAKLLREPVNSLSDLRALAEIVLFDKDSLPSDELLEALFSALIKLDNHRPSRTFDAARWLDLFESSGGGWHENGGNVTLLRPANGSDNLSAFMWELRTRDGMEAVKAEILRRTEQASEPSPTWAALYSAFQTADAQLAEHCSTLDDSKCGSPENVAHEAKTDKLTDQHSDAFNALFRFPSPSFDEFYIKVRLYADHDVCCWSEGKEFAQIIANEAKRFAA